MRNLLLHLPVHRLVWIGCGVLCWVGMPSVWANPSSRDASKPLAIHATVPEATEFAKKTHTLANEAEEFIIESEAIRQKKGPGAVSAKQLSYFRGNLAVAKFHAERLRVMGEPLSADLQLRLGTYEGQVQSLVKDFMFSPQGAPLRPKLIDQLKKSLPSREKKLQQIRSMVQGNQLDAAENAMDTVSVEVEGLIHFLYPEEYKPHMGTYYETAGAVHSAMGPKRLADVQSKLNAAMVANAQDPSELTKWASTIANELRTSGQATGQDQKKMTGPECLVELSRRWSVAHAAVQRAAGLSWALKSTVESSYGSQDTSGASALASQWSTQALAAMTQIIQADAQSVAPEAVPQRHLAYLQAIDEMVSLGNSTALRDQAKSALAALVAKSPQYQTSVNNYHAATRDVIVFRQRIASQAATAMSTQFAPADALMQENTRCAQGVAGLFPEQSTVPVSASLIHPSKQTLQAITPKLVGKRVQTARIVPVPGANKMAASRLDGRTYAMTSATTLPETAIASMKSDLLVDAQHPALSLDAFHLIHAAETGNYESVGGSIEAVNLEGLVTRFVSMPDAASIIVPRGEVKTPDPQQSILSQMVLRVDLKPQWINFGWGVAQVASP